MRDIDAFRKDVETFISEQGMSPTRFGKEFAGDPRFVFQLREGREPRSDTRERVRSAMNLSQKRSATEPAE